VIGDRRLRGRSQYHDTPYVRPVTPEYQKQRSARKVAFLVLHKDIHLENMPLNVKNQPVMIVDSERSTVHQRNQKMEFLDYEVLHIAKQQRFPIIKAARYIDPQLVSAQEESEEPGEEGQ
jgi:hypothetical protein